MQVTFFISAADIRAQNWHILLPSRYHETRKRETARYQDAPTPLTRLALHTRQAVLATTVVRAPLCLLLIRLWTILARPQAYVDRMTTV